MVHCLENRINIYANNVINSFKCFRLSHIISIFHAQGCGNADCLKIVCQVGHLERGKSAILYLKSRLWTQTFMNVSKGVQYVPASVTQ